MRISLFLFYNLSIWSFNNVLYVWIPVFYGCVAHIITCLCVVLPVTCCFMDSRKWKEGEILWLGENINFIQDPLSYLLFISPFLVICYLHEKSYNSYVGSADTLQARLSWWVYSMDWKPWLRRWPQSYKDGQQCSS